MKYDGWKFCITENDFYYFRYCEDGSIVKVYPVFSMNIIKGPTGIINWNSKVKGKIISFSKKIDVMFYVDIELSNNGCTLEKPFFFYGIEDAKITNLIREFYINKKKDK